MRRASRAPAVIAVALAAVLVAGCARGDGAGSDGQEDTDALGPGDEVVGMRLTTATATDTDMVGTFCDSVLREIGTFHRECEVPALQRLLIGWGNIAPSPEILEEEWQAETWALFLDGRPVDLAAFGTLPDRQFFEPAVGGPVWLRQWSVALVNPKQGEHTLRYVIELTGAGEEPVGTRDVTWTFNVAAG
jgi:predicted small secreted protein